MKEKLKGQKKNMNMCKKLKTSQGLIENAPNVVETSQLHLVLDFTFYNIFENIVIKDVQSIVNMGILFGKYRMDSPS